ncbi:hypothetical protein PV11_05303 [Exophiala sideris]|uniref:Gfd2/YDR514C-like C-terminal domain-containing protein n=1 Tax=Exophiala sideris TaxID=1016849 RepID=A0A0D1Z913_9EURO|nr:hypothetical protein PV11_05303 [Exophiala sideris]
MLSAFQSILGFLGLRSLPPGTGPGGLSHSSSMANTAGMDHQHNIASDGLKLLWSSLGLQSESPAGPYGRDNVRNRDILVVSIDFEGLQSIMAATTVSQGQLGIAVLDTRDLSTSLPSSPPIESMITTYNFVTGLPLYCATAARRFLFGETIPIFKQEMLEKLESIIPRTRDIILVGHGFQGDQQVLRYLNFDLQKSILSILDTGKIAREVLASSGSLRDILTRLGCPFAQLHSAGNDANFTPRALLLLAVKSYIGQTLRQETQRTLDLLKGIAQSRIPHQPHFNARAFAEKLMRLQMSREKQAKSLDTTRQESTRVGPAARRAAQGVVVRRNIARAVRADRMSARKLKERQESDEAERARMAAQGVVERQKIARAERAARRAAQKDNKKQELTREERAAITTARKDPILRLLF